MKTCPTCGKGTTMAAKRNLLRGKYNPTPKTRRYPNLQWATFPNGERLKICASCIKKGHHIQPSFAQKLLKKKASTWNNFSQKAKRRALAGTSNFCPLVYFFLLN